MDSFDVKEQLRSTFTYVYFTLNTQHYGASVVDLQGLLTNLRRVCKEIGVAFKSCQMSKYTDNDYVNYDSFMSSLDDCLLKNLVASTEECYEIEHFLWQTSCRGHYQLLKSTIPHFTEDDAFLMWRVFNRLSKNAKVGEAEFATIVDRFVESVGVRINGFIHARKHSIGGGIQFFPMLERVCASIPDNVEERVVIAIIRKMCDELLGRVIKCGSLSKKGHLRRSWKDRWCVLKPGILRYYADEHMSDQKGAICVNAASRVEAIDTKSGHHFKFILVCGKTGRIYEIEAPTDIDRVEWIQALKSVMQSDGKCPMEVEISHRRKGDFELLWGSPVSKHANISAGDVNQRIPISSKSLVDGRAQESSSDSENEVFVNDRSATITLPVPSNNLDLAAKLQQLKEQHAKLKMGLAHLEQDYKRDKGKKSF